MRTMRWIGVGFSAIVVAQARAAAFTAADSGWVPLFNGKKFEGLYSRMYNAEVTPYSDIEKFSSIRHPGADSVDKTGSCEWAPPANLGPSVPIKVLAGASFAWRGARQASISPGSQAVPRACVWLCSGRRIGPGASILPLALRI